MNYNFLTLKNGLVYCEDRLLKDLSSIHTGRATAGILDGVFINSYGSNTAISHVSAITTDDARTLRIAPWDKQQIKEIEKAVNNANLGVSVSVDDQGLRIFFPELTTERRASFVKIIKDKLESARVCVRNEREKTLNDINKKEKDGEISEDEKFQLKEDLQKIIASTNDKFDNIFNKKEKEILS